MSNYYIEWRDEEEKGVEERWGTVPDYAVVAVQPEVYALLSNE